MAGQLREIGVSAYKKVQFLDIQWNAAVKRRGRPSQKVRAITGLVQSILSSRRWSWMAGKRLLDHLNFAAFVVPFGRIRLRPIQRACLRLSEGAPDAQFSIPPDAQWALVF